MIRAEIKFKNATFMKALEKNGYRSILQFSKTSGIGIYPGSPIYSAVQSTPSKTVSTAVSTGSAGGGYGA